MSRLARAFPDQPDMWDAPPVHPPRRRCADPRCGRRVSWDGTFCAEHDEAPPDPDVCGNCDHQRSFHFAEHDGICFGPDCDCCEFEPPPTNPNGTAA